MHFQTLNIVGAMKVKIDAKADSRGFFARTFCTQEFAARGLPISAVQASISYNALRGTLRGMHFQWPPSQEGKLVRCIRGAICDVLVDLRPESPSYLRHEVITLDDHNRDAVFIPPGIAHGFQTLANDSEVLYQMTDFYEPTLQGGFRWNDPAFAIQWPIECLVISDRDAGYADFNRHRYEVEFAKHRLGSLQ
jgi:dTDP-4-dehydrorhamnose 3,5-epimerase